MLMRVASLQLLPLPADQAALSAFENDLVARLKMRDAVAAQELFDHYAPYVYRVLLRTLGPDDELADLLHDVFVAALAGINGLHNAAALRGWLASTAIFSARGFIRRRRRRRLLGLLLPSQAATTSVAAPPDVGAALHAAYRVLATLPTDERIAFTLRVIEGLTLAEIADVCRAPEPTIKRRVNRARDKFGKRAARIPLLKDWVHEENLGPAGHR